MAKPNIIAKEIFDTIGGDSNINSYYNCVTRLRFQFKKTDKSVLDKLKDIDGVIQVVESGREVQVVIGPNVNKVRSEFSKLSSITPGEQIDSDLDSQSNDVKNSFKEKQTSPIHAFLAKFSKIFVPLIPGFIAAGLLSGIGALLTQTMNPKAGTFVFDLVKYISVFQLILTNIMGILIGYNTANAFGGSGVNGAIIAGLYMVTFGPVPIAGSIPSGINTAFGVKLSLFGGKIHGSIIGVLVSAWFGAKVEVIVRRYMPAALDMALSSSIVLLINGLFTLFPIAWATGYLFDGISWLFITLSGSPLGSALLAGLFLITVVFGVHQGFIPVYTSLIKSVKYNALFPILAMAGAGQVGASLALFVKAHKDSKIRKQIGGAIIPGILGIGEPLIYGITLPRVKPFITASLGAAVGGLFLGLMPVLGIKFGLNSVFGPSGILAAPLMTSPTSGIVTAMVVYVSGILISYVAGFVITYFFGTKGVDLD